jgi:hypothetical protein
MRWLKWGLITVLLIGAIVVFSTKIFQKKYTFYYYPEWNAYYDVKNKNYFYSIDGGKTWDTISNSSNTVANTLGNKIVLQSSTPQIWMENALHRSQYGGMLNDLVGNFLETGEDKRPIKKKTIKDSLQYAKNKADSLARDSIAAIENWVKEKTVQENTAKEPQVKEEEKTDPVKEESTEESAGDSTEAENN